MWFSVMRESDHDLGTQDPGRPKTGGEGDAPPHRERTQSGPRRVCSPQQRNIIDILFEEKSHWSQEGQTVEEERQVQG